MWQQLPNQAPGNGETVWVRLTGWFGPPFQAVWDEGTQTFSTADTELVCPWYVVFRWKSL